MSDNDVPAAPDYSAITSAQANLASGATNNSNTLMQWAKDQFANNKGLVDDVNNGLLHLRDSAYSAADDLRTRGKGLIDSGVNYLRDTVDKYNNPIRKAADMGAAQANVAQNFDAARDNATRELEGFGVNPASTRFAALDLGVRTQQAAAMASAGNVASRTDEALAGQANDKLVAQGNTDTGNSNSAAATGTTAGLGGVNSDLALTASGANTQGTAPVWSGIAGNALTGQGNTLHTSYSDQLAENKANQTNSSGIGSLIGTVAGLSKNSLGGSMLMALEEGGAIPGPEGGTTGGAIPISASPSRGAQTDDVNAKVNAGEFVVPKDVAAWKGEEFFQKLIQQSRKMKGDAPAKPSVTSAIPGPSAPAFQSRPTGGGALPMQ